MLEFPAPGLRNPREARRRGVAANRAIATATLDRERPLDCEAWSGNGALG
jgi:hypothetical protein